MPTPVVVDVVRTPLGRRNGRLAGWHPVDLLAEVLRALVERNDLDPGLVDDVIAGCVMQVGEQGLNVARNAVLAAGLPEEVPATTVDRPAARPNRPSTSPPREWRPAPTTWCWPAASNP